MWRLCLNGRQHERVRREGGANNPATIGLTTLYREVRNGPSFDPIALKVGMVAEAWLPGAADQMVYGLAQGTSREAVAHARQHGRLPFSRSSFEWIGHEVGKLYVERQVDIDQEVIETLELPEGAAELATSIDRVSLPMEGRATSPVDARLAGAARLPHAHI